MITGFLGAFHGIGLASRIEQLAVRTVNMPVMSREFLIGAGIGLLIFALPLIVLLFFLRKRSFYVPAIVRGGSIAAIAFAVGWLALTIVSS